MKCKEIPNHFWQILLEFLLLMIIFVDEDIDAKGRGADGGFWNFFSTADPLTIILDVFLNSFHTPMRLVPFLRSFYRWGYVSPEKLSDFLKVTQFAKAKSELIWSLTPATGLSDKLFETSKPWNEKQQKCKENGLKPRRWRRDEKQEPSKNIVSLWLALDCGILKCMLAVEVLAQWSWICPVQKIAFSPNHKAINSQGWGTSLVDQWLRLHSSTAGGTGLIPGWRTMILHAVWWRQEN